MPVLRLRRRPGRQRKLIAVIATHPRATDRNLAAVEADLAFGSAPALPHSVAAPAMRFAGELLGILAQHLLNSFNPSRQTKALKRAVHILPSRRKAGHERERWGHGSAGHGVALLCGFGTPSLTAQGGQRLHPYFNNGRDIPVSFPFGEARSPTSSSSSRKCKSHLSRLNCHGAKMCGSVAVPRSAILRPQHS